MEIIWTSFSLLPSLFISSTFALKHHRQRNHPLLLNPPQQEAVDHGAGPCLVIAGAGSGKTRVLTSRIERLVIQGVKPWRILGFTFTNKAAGEMRARLETSLGQVARRLWLGTFHATGVRILRREWEAAGIARDFGIYDADDQQALLKRVIADLSLPDGSFTPQSARGVIERLNRSLIRPEQFRSEQKSKREWVYEEIFIWKFPRSFDRVLRTGFRV